MTKKNASMPWEEWRTFRVRILGSHQRDERVFQQSIIDIKKRRNSTGNFHARTAPVRRCVAGQSVAAVAGALACPHLTLRDGTSETTRLDRERMLENVAGDIHLYLLHPLFRPPQRGIYSHIYLEELLHVYLYQYTCGSL